MRSGSPARKVIQTPQPSYSLNDSSAVSAAPVSTRSQYSREPESSPTTIASSSAGSRSGDCAAGASAPWATVWISMSGRWVMCVRRPSDGGGSSRSAAPGFQSPQCDSASASTWSHLACPVTTIVTAEAPYRRPWYSAIASRGRSRIDSGVPRMLRPSGWFSKCVAISFS